MRSEEEEERRRGNPRLRRKIQTHRGGAKNYTPSWWITSIYGGIRQDVYINPAAAAGKTMRRCQTQLEHAWNVCRVPLTNAARSGHCYVLHASIYLYGIMLVFLRRFLVETEEKLHLPAYKLTSIRSPTASHSRRSPGSALGKSAQR